jgi:hypothetical protein
MNYLLYVQCLINKLGLEALNVGVTDSYYCPVKEIRENNGVWENTTYNNILKHEVKDVTEIMHLIIQLRCFVL